MVETKIFFAENSAALAAVTAPLLDDIVATVKLRQVTQLEIRGHADSAEHDSDDLSERRALAVRDAMVVRGMSPKIIVTNSYGAGLPLDDDRVDPSLNRRVDFTGMLPQP